MDILNVTNLNFWPNTNANKRWCPWFTELVIATITAGCLLLAAGNVVAAQAKQTYTESQIKVALVYKLLHFIEWPPSQDLTLCVYGANDEEASSFRSMPRTTEFGGVLNVNFLHKSDDFRIKDVCQLSFFSHNTNVDIKKILAEMEDTPILTIGESHQFIEQGGMINLIRKDLTLSFEINLGALKQAGLGISSQVLRIADQIHTNGSDE